MDYTYDEIHEYVQLLCKRLDVPNLAVVMDPSIPTSYNHKVMLRPAHININPFCSYIASMPMEMVLAHEVRHYWQNYTGILAVNTIYGGMYWEGKLLPYIWHSAPWEIDAVLFENEVAIELGYPILRFVQYNTIFQLAAPTKLNTEQQSLALNARKAAA